METRSDLIIKWSVYSVLSLLVLLIQGFLPEIRLFGVTLFLPPVLVALLASLEPNLQGAVFALCFGLVCDFALLGPIPCFYLVSFLLIALLSALISTRILNAELILSLSVAPAGILLSALLRYLLMLAQGTGSFADALLYGGKELLLTMPFVVPLHFLFIFFHRRFHFYG